MRRLPLPQSLTAIVVAAVAVVGCVLVSFRLAPASDLFVLLGIALLLGGLITAIERGRQHPVPTPRRSSRGQRPSALPDRRPAARSVET